ncbi:hypothetical protein GF339_03810 [candidate division KSB3 bacterium]|uniref:Transporter n=1 Tax=candidate division KSB3 bacterium TaxID=2044937 RepID=A0A9D5Q4G1_9BACT|nr:hypothetical protein [candidate division KSB3 bacterium]MBD3323684.1 hypothetical protein [candidate division KSB3 bacterium]
MPIQRWHHYRQRGNSPHRRAARFYLSQRARLCLCAADQGGHIALIQQLSAAFTTVFFLLALGFLVQHWRPLAEHTIEQLANLVIEILLPFYLFFSIATTSADVFRQAPILIGMGVVTTLCNYYLARLALTPLRVHPERQAIFCFANAVPNTMFFGVPICVALFGPLGLIYTVLYDLGIALVVFTFGIWKLRGGRVENWRLLLRNPLLWSVIAGLGWSWLGGPFPGWLAEPFRTVGNSTLPLALLICGTQLAHLQASGSAWRRQLIGLSLLRLIISPLLWGAVFALIRWHDFAAQIIVIGVGMPVGLATALFAKNYGADAEFAASATFWTTVGALFSLPLIVLLVKLIAG